jgi:hypothetical protein
MKTSYIRYAFLLTALFALSSCVISAKDNTKFAFTAGKTSVKNTGDKYEFCQDYNNYYSNGKKNVSKKDLREITIGASSLLEVDGQKNGGISVRGENRGDILIRACVNTWAPTEEEATANLNNTRIETGGVIKAMNADENARYSVSYQILVPTQTNLKLTAKNGGISISGVNGSLQFETKNGGVSLRDVAGDVKGMTKNGGVSVKLSGPAFQGNGLDVETKNGGVSLSLPTNYAANVETGTVNGGFTSDFAELKVEKDENGRYYRPKKVNASINGGGAKIRVVTTNGGVRIKSSEE